MLGYGMHAACQTELVQQLRTRGFIEEPRLVEAMTRVDRAAFLPPNTAEPYSNNPIKVSECSSVSTPQLHAQVLQLLAPAFTSSASPRSFLDFGCGTGYLASVAAEIGVDRVIASESDETAHEAARKNLEAYTTVKVMKLFPEESYSSEPFTALYVSPYFSSKDEALKFCSQWLRPDGLAVCSYADCSNGLDEQLALIEKKSDGSLNVTPQFRVAGGALREDRSVDGSKQAVRNGPEIRELNKRLLLGWRERFEGIHGRRPTRSDMFADPKAADAFRLFSGTQSY
ncbi:Protein-L-isoaspartate O-methyltransferase domain-containing protein 1 [Perkinsus chesapeaki]|uniref:protein-L-isoaspartate(D-aspartate) O-methyltransferase n=1 Tax=Perkinsus chesapeaki TaxID=330153 RepID=A0A7J6L2L7_PERCH|nr:Protein-L-isoaspartate O-methyltransferase domain-containing protein 1 [Perkinsus chesapeaki]